MIWWVNWHMLQQIRYSIYLSTRQTRPRQLRLVHHSITSNVHTDKHWLPTYVAKQGKHNRCHFYSHKKLFEVQILLETDDLWLAGPASPLILTSAARIALHYTSTPHCTSRTHNSNSTSCILVGNTTTLYCTCHPVSTPTYAHPR